MTDDAPRESWTTERFYLVVSGDRSFITKSPLEAMLEVGWYFGAGACPSMFQINQPASAPPMAVYKLPLPELYMLARQALPDRTVDQEGTHDR